ncbi:MAG: CAP domain-containing protein [Actinoplanes sp.]
MRSSITKRLALIAMIPATLLAMVMVASPASAATASAMETKLQADAVTLTNQQRAAHGCKAVKADGRLTLAARAHSGYMARTGKFSHVGTGGSSFTYRVKLVKYPSPASENIAYGYRSASDLVKAWMASPGHRANILNCKAATVGVGVVVASNGTPYFTQEFGY